MKNNLRVSFTLRREGLSGEEAAAQARRVLEAVAGVKEVEETDAIAGAIGTVQLVVAMDKDAREALCKALVEANFGVLEMARARELESLFLELLGEGEGPSRQRAHRRLGADKPTQTEEARG
jgi:hypothetical protein